MMKTDKTENVGKHAFEIAGLGKAPFQFVGASENRVTYPNGSSKAGGSCAYCGTGIALECHVKSADGKFFKVGCDCILKVGDEGLLKAYKTSPEFRERARIAKMKKSEAVFSELKRLFTENETFLATLPHPQGFTDRQTGIPLTMKDQIAWLIKNCGASGRDTTLKMLKRALARK